MEVHPRANCRPVCSGCDRLAARRFAFVPLWGRFLVYVPRRVRGRGCGTRVEEMPWPFTTIARSSNSVIPDYRRQADSCITSHSSLDLSRSLYYWNVEADGFHVYRTDTKELPIVMVC